MKSMLPSFVNFGRRTSSRIDDSQSMSSSGTAFTSAPTSQTSTSNERTVADRNFQMSLRDFARRMATAASLALKTPNRPYNKVVAVILYWENPPASLQYLVEQAQNLRDLFKTFNFDVKELPIPRVDLRPINFSSEIEKELDKVRKDHNSLFILYYGGHASWDYGRLNK